MSEESNKKLLAIDFRMFIGLGNSDEIDFEEWGKATKKLDANAWIIDEKGFGVYMKLDGKGLGMDIEFTPDQQKKIKPLLVQLAKWRDIYGEEI